MNEKIFYMTKNFINSIFFNVDKSFSSLFKFLKIQKSFLLEILISMRIVLKKYLSFMSQISQNLIFNNKITCFEKNYLIKMYYGKNIYVS